MIHQKVDPAHQTFPLTRLVLDRLSLTPEFNYPEPYNARELNNRLLPPLPAYTPGELTAVGLIGKIYLKVIDLYLSSSPSSFFDLDDALRSEMGAAYADISIGLMLDHFPTTPLHYSPARSEDYLFSHSADPSKRHGLYKSFLLIYLADINQALRKKDNLFTDPELRQSPRFAELRNLIFTYFKDQSSFQSSKQNLIDFLSEPARLHPDSLFDQLDFIRQHWVSFLGEDFLMTILRAMDRFKEETVATFFGQSPPEDPLGYTLASYQTDSDIVRFSDDHDWMPKVILIAKNIFVWLDQLSKEYQRSIHQLDQIPDQELAKLSSWGITGLWLIGLWQRSSASQKIKQICGNLDAVPSAYSLYDYAIADALGGEEAYQDLSERAALYNIRLAADMVPNHMGIYSKWVIEHPDWFLSVDQPPFPGYSFLGVDLSEDQQVGIFLEDHYYDKTDAAVVFKRVDRHTGSEIFIYHGNDGTSMPWNDTAQLDFLNPEVKEAVIQNILHVAKKFPIIRFDAAMTLAKKHIQRLWFPEPGSGGAIPTRSDYGLSNDEFNKLMPVEFWREVVDRVAIEAPDTLLLAEAFWMMEGYFVRSLGMHRVYNSAFMHMLRDEDNSKYRDLIIKTLEFDPQILKRYVNFMNNPDEDTAISQYGSDGKYFGVCVLMATLPGLPMFGHGQIEGYAEKYGMEYQRAYYDERPNQDLIERHRREIFPLLHKRHLFAEVDNFTLYDFISQDGSINQDVIAYSNRSGDESALIIYHNKWGDTSGGIQTSVPINGSSRQLIESLGFSSSNEDYLLFRDKITGLEYVSELKEFSDVGLRIDLGAYDYRVLMDFLTVSDLDGSYSALFSVLNGRGVPSLHDARIELKLYPLAESVDDVYEEITKLSAKKDVVFETFEKPLVNSILNLESALSSLIVGPESLVPDYQTSTLTRLSKLLNSFHLVFPGNNLSLYISSILLTLLADVYKHTLISNMNYLPMSLAKQPHISADLSPETLIDVDLYTKFSLSLASNLEDQTISLADLIEIWFDEELYGPDLGFNEYDGLTWFNKEAFEALIDLTIVYFLISKPRNTIFNSTSEYLGQLIRLRESIINLLNKSDYQVNLFYKYLLRFTAEWNSQINN